MRVYKQKVRVVCANCGKVEYVYPSRAKNYKCCSRKCIGEYNSKKYSQQVTLVCPICGETYKCKRSEINHHRTCGKPECRSKWLSISRCGENNANYKEVEISLMKTGVANDDKLWRTKYEYQHIAKKILGLDAVSKLPKGYVIHHKDADHLNNVPTNLVMIPKRTHRLIHTIFGNVLIRALHTGKLDRQTFIDICTKEQWDFYKEIIDLDITQQVVIKQGELLEHQEVGNQQPSIYRNIIEGSTTNERVLIEEDIERQ